MSNHYVESSAGDYSTLEVGAARPANREATRHEYQPGMETQIGEGPEVVLNSIYVLQNDSYKAADVAAIRVPPRKRSPVWGCSRRTFIISMVALAAVVVAAVVGGVAGGVLSHPKQRTSSASTSASTTASPSASTSSSPSASASESNTTTSTNTIIHPNSTLAATNWTDTAGYNHRGVFFQDTNSALIGQFWDSQNTTWRTLNITNLLPQQKLQAGSSLAAAAKSINTGQLHVWCLLQDNSIHGYYWDGELGSPLDDGAWQEQSLIGASAESAYPGASLAAAWQPPPYGSQLSSSNAGSWVLVFQNITGDLVAVNYTGSSTIPVDKTGIEAASGVALSARYGGLSSTGLVLSYESDGNVLPSSWPPNTVNGTDWNTADDTDLLLMYGLSSTTDKHQLANLPLTTSGFLYLALLQNGTIQVTEDSTYLRHYGLVTFSSSGPAANFTAMAVSVDGIFYGIQNGSIDAYTINQDSPYIFTYLEVVFSS